MNGIFPYFLDELLQIILVFSLQLSNQLLSVYYESRNKLFNNYKKFCHKGESNTVKHLQIN